MERNGIQENWQQYYPTYKFKERDILLKEYETSTRNVASQEQTFSNITNFIFVLATILGSLTVGMLNNRNLFKSLPLEILLGLVVVICVFSWLTLKYLSERQKSIIFDSRKIVVLRKMLGLDYGRLQLVLPSQRIEGASDPFAIKFFPGWLSSVAYPFWIICLISISLLFVLLPLIIEKLVIIIPHLEFLAVNRNNFRLFIALLWFCTLALTFRTTLYDTNERKTLSFAKLLAWFIALSLKNNFEYVIYRAKLSMYETERIKVPLKILQEILIFIEDRNFFKHKGISIKAIIRAFLSIFRIKRRSGGSTITQQLVRTLFIKDMSKTFRRKVIEILLALWFERICTKEEILKIYLSSVRFDYGVYGVTSAIRHFFGKKLNRSVSKAEAFFLIERISNIKSLILVDKIIHTIKQMRENNMISNEDIAQIKSIYSEKVKSRTLKVLDEKKFDEWIKGDSY